MVLKIAYNNECEKFINDLISAIKTYYPIINLEYYNEDIFKERKKAYAVKNPFAARKTPFAVLIDDEKNPVVAFYSEDNKCNVDEIINTLSNFIIYESQNSK